MQQVGALSANIRNEYNSNGKIIIKKKGNQLRYGVGQSCEKKRNEKRKCHYFRVTQSLPVAYLSFSDVPTARTVAGHRSARTFCRPPPPVVLSVSDRHTHYTYTSLLPVYYIGTWLIRLPGITLLLCESV